MARVYDDVEGGDVDGSRELDDVAKDSLIGESDTCRFSSFSPLLETDTVGSGGTLVGAGVVSSILENKAGSVKSWGTSLPACSCNSFSSSSSSRSLCSCLSFSSLSFFSRSRLSFARRSSCCCCCCCWASFSLFPVLSLSLATALNCFCSHLKASIWFMPYTLREDTGQ